jgi:hypothetical protein
MICPRSKNLNSSLDKWGLIDKGFGYDVVAVFGSQSTGKSTCDAQPRAGALGQRADPAASSCDRCCPLYLAAPTGTLLNRLFGTTFDVMDEKARKQTTKGASCEPRQPAPVDLR